MTNQILKSKYAATEHYQASGRSTGRVELLTQSEYENFYGQIDGERYDPMGNWTAHELPSEMTHSESVDFLIDCDENGYSYLSQEATENW